MGPLSLGSKMLLWACWRAVGWFWVTRSQCLNVLVVKIKVLENFENPGVLPPTAERIDCCRCAGGADKPLELPKSAVNKLVLKRALGWKYKSFLVVLWRRRTELWLWLSYLVLSCDPWRLLNLRWWGVWHPTICNLAYSFDKYLQNKTNPRPVARFV